MKPERIWSARPRLPLKDSSSDEPSGPSARTHASLLPRTTALAEASESASEISTRPREAISR